MNPQNPPSTHQLAIVSLVLSILGLIMVLPLVGSIGAVISGNMSLREIREKPTQFSGDNLARAGVIMGWVGIALAVLALVLVCLALLFFMPVSTQTFPMP